MRIRTRIVLCLAAAVLSQSPARVALAQAPGVVAEPAPEAQSSPAVAERLANIAHTILSNAATIKPETLRQASALLEGAMRLNPQEERYPRLLVEACLQLGDNEASINALQAYRKVQPFDCIAQTRLIDLYSVAMETADKKLEYFKKLTETASLPAEVRAHAAVRCAEAFDERGQSSASAEMIDTALALNPLNATAVMRRWSEVNDDPQASTEKRVSALLQVLRNNPGQPSALAVLAWEYAQAGMIDASMKSYELSFSQSARKGMGSSPDDLIRYAAELALGDQKKAAESTAADILVSDPGSSQFAMLNVLLARRSDDPTRAQPAIRQAQQSLESNLKLLHRQLIKKTPATRPSDVIADNTPDFAGDIEALKAAEPQMLDAYVATLTDLAWLQVYFAKNPPGAQKAMEAIKALQPDDPSNNRLEGWSFLQQNKPDEAKVKLAAVAERDALARIGMMRLAAKDEASQKAVAAEAQKLLDDNAGGPFALLILDTLKELNPKLSETADAEIIKREVAKLPKDWFTILDKPPLFYALRARPLKVTHAFGEPMVVEMTIANTGEADLSLGDNGAVRFDLWFDAQVKGLAQASLGGVKYDRLAQGTLLHPGKSVTQLIRVDEGALSTLLNSNPSPSIPIYFSVFTNPAPSGGGMAPGAGGYRVQFSAPVERIASPMNTQDQQQQVFSRMINGRPDEQVSAVDLIGTYVRLIRKQDNAPPENLAAAKGFAETLERLEGTKDDSVRAWLRYVLVTISEPAKIADRHAKMLTSRVWQERLFGLAAAVSFPPQKQRDAADKLKEDADPTVKKFAAAMLETFNSIPTTRPAATSRFSDTTMPATREN